jgi:alpha/beta superfamily hydrolase
MDNNMVGALEGWLRSKGLMVLAFNFRGVGRSQGGYDQMRGEVDDVIAALTFLARRPEIDAFRVGVVGYSFGGLMAAMAAARLEADDGGGTGDRLRAAAVALVSPMAAAKPWEKLPELKPFYDRTGPSLVVAGTADPFCTVKSAKDLSVELGMNARLVIVEGADHFWAGREDEAAAPVADFFSRAFNLAPL